MVNPNSKLFNHWILTKEDDNGIKVYRTKDPESGNKMETEKDGFEIKENGEFIQHKTSRDGKHRAFKGRFEIEGNTVYSRFKNTYLDSMFTIVELDDYTLKLR